MSLLDANAESLRETALNSSAPPPKPADPGIFQNFIPGAGNYFMRGMAESGRALSMAGAAVPVLADKLIGSDNRGESFGDRYFRWHDETFGRAVDYWTPKPGEVGAAGQVVGSLAAGLTQFLANPALLIGTAQLSTAEDLVRQGVDAGAANVAGDAAALSTLAGIALPIFGKTLAGKIATGAAGNLATNVPQAAITRAVVQAAGAPEVAAQFDPLDLRARTVDLLMGVAFGAKSHIDARAAAKTQAFLEGGIPSKPTAIADAAAQAFESPLTATQRDAIMVMNAARHMDEAALPWKAGEAEHTAAVDNVRTAIAQISRGQEVNVPPIPRGPVTENPNFRAWFGDSKVTDANGAPLVVYHGTNADISAFDTTANSYADEVGTFFTTDSAEASSYGTGGGANVLPAYVSIKNPYTVTDRQWTAREGMTPREAMEAGFDGYVIEQRNGHKHVVAFSPEQIKSAIGNSGRFDPNSASLTDHADLAQSIAESAPKSAEPVAAPKMQTVAEPPPAAGAESKAPAVPQFAEDLRLPTGEFDPATGTPKTISANEYVAKAAAEAEQVKSTAEGLMRTVATCILGGI